MDDLARDLLAALGKSNASTETKLSLFNSVKHNIKHHRMPESAQATTIECTRLAIVSQTTSSLVITGFSTLGHLIKRLTVQDQAHTAFTPRTQILPALLDRLGDSKEPYRTAALQSLCELYPARPMDVEKAVKEGAIQGNNVRAKEAGIQWVTRMHAEHSLQFKSFVPALVECLSHADGGVRETAKDNLVELFRNTSDRAKADLKRQLIAQNVRKSITTHILGQLHIPIPVELGSSIATQSVPRSEKTKHEASFAEEATPAEPALPPSADTTHIEPIYVDSQRSLEDMFRDMAPCFEGRESEGNWTGRDKSVLRIRGLLKGNAPDEFHVAFLGCIKHLLDGILKVFNSLRTTMSKNGCAVIQELARTLGPSIDSMVEILLQNAIKLCSATKTLAAESGNETVNAILSHVSYHVRLMQHIWNSTQDKNVQPRVFASGWLKTILKRQKQHKAGFEHSGGLELAEKSIKKGLHDANPTVREAMRATFWVYAQIWPEKGETLMSTLDAKTRQLLEKDSANPNAEKASFTSSVGPSSSSNPRAAAANPRAALKETIAAQKRAALALKRAPDRPNSAMADISPMRQNGTMTGRGPSTSSTSSSSTSSRSQNSSAASHSSSKPPAALPSSVSQNSLMSGPVRRPKRPEISRPATADPYANRRLLQTETPPTRSPVNSPSKSGSKSGASTAKGHVKHSSMTSMRPGTAESGKSSKIASPRTSPAKARPRTAHSADVSFTSDSGQHNATTTSSPSKEENLTMVLPHGFGAPQTQRGVDFQRQRFEHERPSSKHGALPSMAEEDNLILLAEDKVNSSTRSPKANASIDDGTLNGNGAATENASQDGMTVYEDPAEPVTDGTMESRNQKVVLEEVSPNEQPSLDLNNDATPVLEPAFEYEQRSTSPGKRATPKSGEGQPQDRTEMLKNRRLLSSGIERLRAKTLDPHGFRRLQELVKNSSKDPEVRLTSLLRSLSEYVEISPEALKVNAAKAGSLKSQALTTMRSIIVLHKRDEDTRSELGHALSSTLRCRKTTDTKASLVTDLEKTAFEVIKYAGGRSEECIHATAGILTQEASGHGGMTTMALNVLAKLLATMQARETRPSKQQRDMLGRLAVKYLDDTSSDIRKADTDLCLELHASYGPGGKEEFWESLRGAREAQLNLVAYYLARRGSSSEA